MSVDKDKGLQKAIERMLTTLKSKVDPCHAALIVVDMQNAVGQKVIENPREIPYTFRGQAVILRSVELGLCEITARLLPEYVIKV